MEHLAMVATHAVYVNGYKMREYYMEQTFYVDKYVYILYTTVWLITYNNTFDDALLNSPLKFLHLIFFLYIYIYAWVIPAIDVVCVWMILWQLQIKDEIIVILRICVPLTSSPLPPHHHWE